MPPPSDRLFRIGLSAAGIVVLVGIGFLIANLVNRFSHQPTTAPVAAQVVTVTPKGSSSVTITAHLRLKETSSAQVNCVVAIAKPAIPLAFQSVIPVHLTAGVTQTLVVERTLLHPQAASVTPADVSLACT
jgi:hypothetical protein